MAFGDEVLDRLAPAHAWVADWPEVLDRAGVSRPARPVARRRLVVAFVVLAAMLVPLAAVGAANDWWFLKFGGPAPTKAPMVVVEGEWDGHPWRLIAFPSTTDGLCVSVTPRSSSSAGRGGAMSCGPFAGIARRPETKTSPDMTITYLSGGASAELPAYIAGPVIDKAATVEIRFANGDVLRAPTFAGPESLEGVRFFATQLPAALQAAPTTSAFVERIAGLDASGAVVACLAPQTAENGVSPLSDCRGT